MIKKILNFICCFTVVSIIAQPNIPYVNWGFISLDRFYVSTQNLSPNPVAPGNGVTWDFTGLTSDPADSILWKTLGGSTTFSFDFPQANVTFQEYHASSNETWIQHYYKDQYEFDYIGPALVGTGAAPYNTYQKMLKFPFVFNTSFKAAYADASTYGYVILKYDGYGTLKLPAATHTNVYRTTCKDSVSPSQISYRYEWFDQSRKIMTIEVKGSATTITYLQNPVKPSSNVSDNSIKQRIYVSPNPGTGLFYIALPDVVSQGLIEVTNALGQVILSKDIESFNTDLYIKEKGLYMVTVYSGKQKYSQKVIVN